MDNVPSGAFCLEGHIDVPDDRTAGIEIALEEHITLTRTEPGCIFFNVEPCTKVPGRFPAGFWCLKPLLTEMPSMPINCVLPIRPGQRQVPEFHAITAPGKLTRLLPPAF